MAWVAGCYSAGLPNMVPRPLAALRQQSKLVNLNFSEIVTAQRCENFIRVSSDKILGLYNILTNN